MHIAKFKQTDSPKILSTSEEARAQMNRVRDEVRDLLAKHGVQGAIVGFAVHFKQDDGGLGAVPGMLMTGGPDILSRLMESLVEAFGIAMDRIESAGSGS